MKKPIVQVIIPSFNHAKYIQQTIESVVMQSYGKNNIQLLVIDDNSTDNSQVLLRKLEKTYGFTLFQNDQNKGIVKNINQMLKKAKGKYIAILGSDDTWEKIKLDKQVALLEEKPNYGAVSANCIRIDSKGNPLPKKTETY